MGKRGVVQHEWTGDSVQGWTGDSVQGVWCSMNGLGTVYKGCGQHEWTGDTVQGHKHFIHMSPAHVQRSSSTWCGAVLHWHTLVVLGIHHLTTRTLTLGHTGECTKGKWSVTSGFTWGPTFSEDLSRDRALWPDRIVDRNS